MVGEGEDPMDVSFWLGLVIGFVAGGGVAWYFKILPLQQSVLNMTGEFRKAERGRKILLQERNRQ